MKIGIISDIHVDINQDYDVLKTLVVLQKRNIVNWF